MAMWVLALCLFATVAGLRSCLLLALGFAFLVGADAAISDRNEACTNEYLCLGSNSEYIISFLREGECRQGCYSQDALAQNNELFDWSCGPCPTLTQSQQKARSLSVLSKEELLAEQAKVLSIDWEWVVFKYFSVDNLPRGTAPTLSVRAVVDQEPDIKFSRDRLISSYSYPAGDASSYWVGFVAYPYDSASSLEVTVNSQDGDILVQEQVVFPTMYDEWTDVTIDKDGIQINMSVRRSNTPIVSSDEQTAMEASMTEKLIDLANGEKASLAYKINDPVNTKAVLYFPGRFDSFGQPHLLETYASRGFDFYTLDPRRCGRVAQFLDDPHYMNSLKSFDEYREEIDYTMEFIRSQKSYTTILTHGFSTGALAALNYRMLLEEESDVDPFDGYILESPLLDWGYVTSMEEFGLENAEIARLVYGDIAREATGVSSFSTFNWILYRQAVNWKTLIDGHTTFDYAEACTTVMEKINSRFWLFWGSAITGKPVLSLTSQGDDVVIPEETIERLRNISRDVESVMLEYNNHALFKSFTRAMTDDAIHATASWLDRRFG